MKKIGYIIITLILIGLSFGGGYYVSNNLNANTPNENIEKEEKKEEQIDIVEENNGTIINKEQIENLNYYLTAIGTENLPSNTEILTEENKYLLLFYSLSMGNTKSLSDYITWDENVTGDVKIEKAKFDELYKKYGVLNIMETIKHQNLLNHIMIVNIFMV